MSWASVHDFGGVLTTASDLHAPLATGRQPSSGKLGRLQRPHCRLAGAPFTGLSDREARTTEVGTADQSDAGEGEI